MCGFSNFKNQGLSQMYFPKVGVLVNSLSPKQSSHRNSFAVAVFMKFFEVWEGTVPQALWRGSLRLLCKWFPGDCRWLLTNIVLNWLYLLLLFSRWVVSESLQLHELQHIRVPCPSLSPRVCSNSCPFNGWCYLTSSSVTPFSSCLQSFPASGSFPMSWLFGCGQRIRASAPASVLPVNIEGWFPLGLTGFITSWPFG